MSNNATNAKVAAYITEAEKIALEQEKQISDLQGQVDGYKRLIGDFNGKIAAAVEAVARSGRVTVSDPAALTQKLANNPAGVLHLLTTISEMTPTQVMAPMGPIGRPTKTASADTQKSAAEQRRREVDQEHLASLNLPTHLAADIRRGS